MSGPHAWCEIALLAAQLGHVLALTLLARDEVCDQVAQRFGMVRDDPDTRYGLIANGHVLVRHPVQFAHLLFDGHDALGL